MINFALDTERSLGLSSREAIYQACLECPADHDDDCSGGARGGAAGDWV